MKNISPRSSRSILKDEILHFDNYSDQIDLNKIVIDNILNSNLREGKFLLQNLPNDLTGKLILDVGCGIGATSILFAKRGAKVIGLDVSPKMIHKASALAKLHHTSQKVKFGIGNIEKLKYKNKAFDIVIGKSILHHVDIVKAITEIYRVLKPGGIALFSEPLGYNPLIIIYDKFASLELRSHGERRLNLGDIKMMRQKFKKVDWAGADIFSLILFALDFLYIKFTRSDIPLNWFERVEYGSKLTNWYLLCDRLDQLLPRTAQLLGWKIIIKCQK